MVYFKDSQFPIAILVCYICILVIKVESIVHSMREMYDKIHTQLHVHALVCKSRSQTNVNNLHVVWKRDYVCTCVHRWKMASFETLCVAGPVCRATERAAGKLSRAKRGQTYNYSYRRGNQLTALVRYVYMRVKEFVYTNPYRESVTDYSTQAFTH